VKSRRSSITVDVEVDISEVLEGLNSEEIAQLAREEGFMVIPKGEGDDSLRENTVERASLAVRRMAEVPREVADLFWHVHGRAI
jgi:hypothetical protein